MKRILLLLISLYSISLFAQSITFSGIKEVTEEVNQFYKRVYHVKENAQDTLHGEYHEYLHAVEIAHGYYKNNFPDSTWVFKNPNGQIDRVITMKEGVLNGIQIQFSATGDTSSCSFYKNGLLDGRWVAYYTSGKIKSLTYYLNGNQTGISKTWYENGKLKSSVGYESGDYSGAYITYYENGNVAEECFYVKGKRNGVYKRYTEEGGVLEEMEYKDGRPWTLVRSNDIYGTPNPDPGNLKEGNGYCRLYKGGFVVAECNMKNGLEQGEFKTYTHGKLERVVNYENGRKEGLSIRYYYSGSISYQENFRNDTLDGHSVYYSVNNTKSKEGDFAMGKKVAGTWVEYDGNGNASLIDIGIKDYVHTGTDLFQNSFYKTSDGPVELISFAEEMPSFPGGESYFIEFLRATVQYPKEARKQKVQGTCMVTFVINRMGFVEDIRVVRSVSPEIDAEAIRVIKSMPAWRPGYMNSRPVRVSIAQPVKFVL